MRSVLLAALQTEKPPTERQISDALSGNLCRCTGYWPIDDTARRMGHLSQAALDRTALAGRLHAMRRREPLSTTVDCQTFHAPRTTEQLFQLGAEHRHARILAGSADGGL